MTLFSYLQNWKCSETFRNICEAFSALREVNYDQRARFTIIINYKIILKCGENGISYFL
jgi:hypothetical protein